MRRFVLGLFAAIGIIASLAVLALAMLGHRSEVVTPVQRSWIELVLSIPVVWWAAWPFFVRWAQSIVSRNPNMWTLIGTGVGAAFVYSVAATVAPGLFPASFQEHGRVGVYFEAADVIVSLTLLGQILELKARSSTSAAITLGAAGDLARRTVKYPVPAPMSATTCPGFRSIAARARSGICQASRA